MKRRAFLRMAAAAAAAPFSVRGAEAKLRVGVIGHTGRGNYGHGLDTMWRLVEGTEIAAVADADPKGLDAAKKRLETPNGFADYRAMLESARPDIVAVCPRFVDQHRDMILAAVEAGARGIYIEKPFCRSPKEADEILAASAKRGVKLAVAHRNRYHPALAAVKRMVEENAIGRVLEFRGRGKEDERGGAEDLWVLGSHVINLAHHLGGDPLGCSAWIGQEGRPITRADAKPGNEGLGPLAGDAVHARYDLTCGAPFFFDSIRRAGTKEAGFGLQVVGNAGVIDLRIDRHPLAHLLAGNPFLPNTEPRAWVPISSAGPGLPEPNAELPAAADKHILAGRDLVAAIREDRPPLCDARQGAATIGMICAAFQSHLDGGRRVAFPLESRENPLTQ